MLDYLKSSRFDELDLIFALTGFLITMLTILIARTQIKEKVRYYYLINMVFMLSFFVIIFHRNWLIFFIAWELVTLSTALMLLWKSKGLASQYFIVQFVGSSFLLYIILLAIKGGYTEIGQIEDFWLQNLFILGFGMKSAIFGLHFWLPPIYAQAPVIFNAISSGWVAKLGFITLLRLIPEGNYLLLVLGLLMVFYGGFKALLAADYKVLLAYSSISQLGYIAIGIGSGTIYGYLGSILHIIAHALTKTGLFIGSNNLIREYGSRSIYDFRGAWSRQKLTSLSILFGFGSLMGLPLLAGYNGKYLIKYGFKSELLLTVFLYAGSLLTILYSIRFLYWGIFKDFFRNQHNSRNEPVLLIHKLVLMAVIFLIVLVGLNAGGIIAVIDEFDFNLNLLIGLLEVTILLLVSLIILKGGNWFKTKYSTPPSLDLFFSRVNKGFYNGGRYLYNLLYQEFQYQLLLIPLFLLFLFLWYLIF